MKIGFYHSNLGGSPLVVGLQRGLEACGHPPETFVPSRHYDLVFVFNQCAHTTAYFYPAFPSAIQKVVFIDSAEYGYFTRLPAVAMNYANAFSPSSMSHDTKNRAEQERLRQFLFGRSFPYFLRDMSNYVTYPQGYHPIDYPLYAYSACPQQPNRDQYLRRDLELFVSWGASHPWRLQITQALRGCHTKCEISVIGEDGKTRMPQGQFFERTRAAKASVSFDGYGSGSFRVHEVLVRTLLLQGPLSVRRHAPLVKGVHCLEYGVKHDGETFISTDVGVALRRALDNPEEAFRIHEAGYHHCMEKYTELATAQYVMAKVMAHDWSKATPLSV